MLPPRRKDVSTLHWRVRDGVEADLPRARHVARPGPRDRAVPIRNARLVGLPGQTRKEKRANAKSAQRAYLVDRRRSSS